MFASKWLPVAISVACALMASCSKPGSAESNATPAESRPIVAVQNVAVDDLSRSLALTAEFVPYQEVDLMSKVAGFVKVIKVDIGDHVRTSQLIAILEVPEMADDLTKAAAGIERSKSEVKRAEGEVDRAKAAHEIAHLSYQRLAEVSKSRPGLVAEQELDEARTKDLSAEGQMAAAQSNFVAAQQETAVGQAEQARYKTLYNYSRVVAPFDGVITARYANTGSMIQAGTASQTQAMPLVRISQNSLLRLRLPVPESDVSHVHVGQQLEVRVSALNRSFPGKVVRFTDTVSTATRTMETEVDVPNPSLVLIPGMYATVDLQLEHKAGVLSIPVTAIDLSGTQQRVFKVNRDGSVAITPVTIGLETADKAEVTSGLSKGDMVVVGNRSGLKPGDKVTPKLVDIQQKPSES